MIAHSFAGFIRPAFNYMIQDNLMLFNNSYAGAKYLREILVSRFQAFKKIGCNDLVKYF